MSRALVLNASYEALCIVSSRRALILTLIGKAEMVHAGAGRFHAETVSFAVPSIVRLLHYVKVPYHAGTALNRRAVFVRDGGRCQYCNNAAESIDHVVPRSRGGTHTWENVVAACRPCNSRKRDRLLEETTFILRRPPSQPRQRVWMLTSTGAVTPEWLPYLGVEADEAGAALSA